MTNSIYLDITAPAVLRAIAKDRKYGRSLFEFDTKGDIKDVAPASDRILALREVVFDLIRSGYIAPLPDYIAYRCTISSKGLRHLGTE